MLAQVPGMNKRALRWLQSQPSSDFSDSEALWVRTTQLSCVNNTFLFYATKFWGVCYAAINSTDSRYTSENVQRHGGVQCHSVLGFCKYSWCGWSSKWGREEKKETSGKVSKNQILEQFTCTPTSLDFTLQVINCGFSEYLHRGLQKGQTKCLKTIWEPADMVKVREAKGWHGQGKRKEWRERDKLKKKGAVDGATWGSFWGAAFSPHVMTYWAWVLPTCSSDLSFWPVSHAFQVALCV